MWDGERFVSLSVDRKRELEIPLSQPLKVGWLMKEGLKVKSWRKRWFVLVPGFLFYFRKEDDAKPRGGLFLEDCAIAVKQRAGEASGSDDDSGDPPPPDYPWEFFVRGGRFGSSHERLYRLSAASREEVEEWVERVRECQYSFMRQLAADERRKKEELQEAATMEIGFEQETRKKTQQLLQAEKEQNEELREEIAEVRRKLKAAEENASEMEAEKAGLQKELEELETALNASMESLEKERRQTEERQTAFVVQLEKEVEEAREAGRLEGRAEGVSQTPQVFTDDRKSANEKQSPAKKAVKGEKETIARSAFTKHTPFQQMEEMLSPQTNGTRLRESEEGEEDDDLPLEQRMTEKEAEKERQRRRRYMLAFGGKPADSEEDLSHVAEEVKEEAVVHQVHEDVLSAVRTADEEVVRGFRGEQAEMYEDLMQQASKAGYLYVWRDGPMQRGWRKRFIRLDGLELQVLKKPESISTLSTLPVERCTAYAVGGDVAPTAAAAAKVLVSSFSPASSTSAGAPHQQRHSTSTKTLRLRGDRSGGRGHSGKSKKDGAKEAPSTTSFAKPKGKNPFGKMSTRAKEAFDAIAAAMPRVHDSYRATDLLRPDKDSVEGDDLYLGEVVGRSGSSSFSSRDEEADSSDLNCRSPLLFAVKEAGQKDKNSCLFLAETEAERREWLDALRKAIGAGQMATGVCSYRALEQEKELREEAEFKLKVKTDELSILEAELRSLQWKLRLLSGEEEECEGVSNSRYIR